jgi:hypothetical protein
MHERLRSELLLPYSAYPNLEELFQVPQIDLVSHYHWTQNKRLKPFLGSMTVLMTQDQHGIYGAVLNPRTYSEYDLIRLEMQNVSIAKGGKGLRVLNSFSSANYAFWHKAFNVILDKETSSLLPEIGLEEIIGYKFPKAASMRKPIVLQNAGMNDYLRTG